MIVILDFGSQYSQLIARRIRELNIYSKLLPYDTSWDEIYSYDLKGIILSGGPRSIYDKHPYLPDERIWESDVPLLGICYGMQLIANQYRGKVEQATVREYGTAEIQVNKDCPLFDGVPEFNTVYMSHSDQVTDVPLGLSACAISTDCEIAAFYEPIECKLAGFQFHPEVVHSVHGQKMLENFVVGICGEEQTWTPDNFIENQVREIKRTVGTENVLLALSGGVDSTTLAFLLHKAIGDQLTCVFLDQGFMREGEVEHLIEIFDGFGMNIEYIDASDRFMARVRGVSDPETKRKRIGHEFISVFQEYAAESDHHFKFLAQGTLYPDVIESSAKSSKSKVSVKIKSHHNVGGLPEALGFELIEPFRMLFKDEVRTIGEELGVPYDIVHRHPFPGPGLAIRIIGEITPERLAMVRKADAILREEIEKEYLYYDYWQVFVVLLATVRSVGVMGDNRTYENPVVIRMVESEDGMTCEWAAAPYHVLKKISNRIVNEVTGVNRVTYDITSKPPGTIEWE